MDTKLCFFNTMKILDDGGYYAHNGAWITIDMDSMLKGTKLYSTPIKISAQQNYNTILRVYNADSFTVAQQLVCMGCRVAVLNMCSDQHIGGLVVYCATAQEETLVCRSSLIKSLYLFAQEPANINTHSVVYYAKNLFNQNYGAIYSPNVTVFRDEKYYLIDKPFKVGVISVPAIKHPNLVDGRYLSKEDFDIVKNKVRTILNVSIANSHDTIVLGAMGCGAYGNSPACIAMAFKEVLQEELYKSSLKCISFAILGDENYRIFSNNLLNN